MSELFDAVDALLASRATLPPPAERKRLRAAHGLTIDEVAGALKVRRATVSGWESGKTEPRPPERDAYARLLDGLAKLCPAVGAPAPAQDAAAPATFTAAPAPVDEPTLSTAQAPEAAVMTATENTSAPSPVTATPPAATRPARTTRPSTSRRPGARKAAPAETPAGGTNPRFENGPLAVVDVEDGKVLAYCTGGLLEHGARHETPGEEAGGRDARLDHRQPDADGDHSPLVSDRASDLGQPDQQLQEIAAEALKETYFQDGGLEGRGMAAGFDRFRP